MARRPGPWIAAVRRWAADDDLRRALAWVLALRVILGVWGVVAIHLSPLPPGPYPTDPKRDLYLVQETPAWESWLVGPWQRWDALHFQRIAQSGYQTPFDVGFYPLYPLMTRLVSSALWIDVPLAQLLVSTIASVVGLTLLERLVRTDCGPTVAQRSVTVMMLFPTAFFLLAGYAEALLLALSVATFLAVRRDRWFLGGLTGALAAITRPQGILLFGAMAVEVVSDIRRRRDAGLPPLRWRHLCAGAPLAAFGLFVLVSRLRAGINGPFGGTEAGNRITPPWTTITDSVRTILEGGYPQELFNLMIAVAAVALILYGWRRVPGSYLAYAGLLAVGMLLHESYTSSLSGPESPLNGYSRYFQTVFPFSVILAVWLGTMPPRFRAVLALGSAALGLDLFTQFAHFTWVA